jgi:survival-of-motor-neuron-related-splicing factor 30
MDISSAQDTLVFLEMVKIDKSQVGSKCWIGLKRKHGVTNGFTWNSEAREIRFVHWNPESARDGMKLATRGAIHPDGTWSLLPDHSTLKCFVCEAAAGTVDSILTLKFFPSFQQLRLRVYFPHGLWKESEDDKGFLCFTDSGGAFARQVGSRELWSREWTLDDIKMLSRFRRKGGTSNLRFHVHKKIYRLEYDKKSSGNFWCEGHKVQNLEIIKSNTVLLIGEESGPIYSLLVDVHGNCNNGKDMTKCDPTISDVLERIAVNLTDKIPRSKIASLKVMRLINAFSNGTLRVVVHIQSRQRNRTALLDDYEETTSAVRRTLDGYKDTYTFRSLHSIQDCPPDVTYDDSTPLNWKRTPRGSTCVSEELCLEADGLPVHRKCSGDCIHGAEWNEPSGKCVNKHISEVTRSLHNLASSVASDNELDYEGLAEEVNKLVSNPSLLTTVDLYYVSRIMKELARTNDRLPSLATIIHILNNVQKANGESVKLSQTYFNSTNILLDSLQRLMEGATDSSTYRDDGVLLAVTSQVIVQISDPIVSNVTGLVLLRNASSSNSSTMSSQGYRSFEEFEIKPLKMNDNDPDFLQNLNDVEVAVWVPQDVIMEYVKGDKNTSWYDLPSDWRRYVFSLLKHAKNRPKIVIVVFYDDHIFQNISKAENYNGEEYSTNRHDSVVVSRVVSVSIPGYNPDLPMPIPIIFRPLVNTFSAYGAKERQCAFWDFTYNSSSPGSSFGGWSAEGCVYAGNSTADTSKLGDISSLLNVLDICVCTHLTHFSELMTGFQDRATTAYGFVESDYHHKKALDIISLFGCSLSLLGVLGIAVTATLFKSWRQKPGTKVLLQLSLALGIQMVIFILSSADIVQSGYEKHPEECTPKSFELHEQDEAEVPYEDDTQAPLDNELLKNKISDSIYDVSVTMMSTVGVDCPTFEQTIMCTIAGALLHYSVLSAFAWMLITALLQFFRYVRVLGATRPPRFFLKAMLFGWVGPLIPVLLVLTLAPSSYIPPSPESTILCYPSGLPLYLGILLPIGLIVVTNLVMYVRILCSVAKISDRCDRCESPRSRSLVLQQLRLGFVLFFLLGLSWLFGLMAALGAGFVFSYLFCVSGTVQGFVLFLFFVVCDPSTRNLWTTTLGLWKKSVVRASNNTTDFLSITISSITSSQKPEPSSQTS